MARDDDLKLLQWLSSHVARDDYKKIRHRTKTDEEYKDHCKWILTEHSFKTWRQLGKGSALWLNGTIGTGKTTIMAQIYQELQKDPWIDVRGIPIAHYFFDKAQGGSTSSLKSEACLRSLARQLSWDAINSEIYPAAKDSFNQARDELSTSDSTLDYEEVEELLVKLLSDRDAYILIDAIDECNAGEYGKLLTSLKKIMSRSPNKEGKQGVHLLLCSRSDTPVKTYFPQVPTISTNSQSSKNDIEAFVDTEIDSLAKIKDGLRFFTSEKNFPAQLKKLLKQHARGLFRWVEIQIAVFTNDNYFFDDKSIEDELENLKTRTINRTPGRENCDILVEEYQRLFDRLKFEHVKERAIRLLQLLSCDGVFFGAEVLAQAMTLLESRKVTRSDVRSCLVGFVSENQKASRSLTPLLLAHASVLEYLQTTATADRFTRSAIHIDAASLYLTSLKAMTNPGLPYAGTRELATISNKQQLRNACDHLEVRWREEFWKLPSVYQCSCAFWLSQCKVALCESENSPSRNVLIESLREFILDEAFSIWVHFHRTQFQCVPLRDKPGHVITSAIGLCVPYLECLDSGLSRALSFDAKFWDSKQYWQVRDN